MRYLGLILRREALMAYRQRAEVLQPCLFSLMVVSLFPLALSPDPKLLRIIAPGVLWVVMLLAVLLAVDRVFRRDVEDGVIEQWLLAPVSFPGLVFAKLFSHWLIHLVPFLILIPLLGMWLQLPLQAQGVLLLSLLLATPTLHFIGAIFAALTVRIRQAGLLLMLLVLPFYVPVLIFAASAVSSAAEGLPATGQLAFLGALLAITLPVAPWIAAAALKVGMSA